MYILKCDYVDEEGNACECYARHPSAAFVLKSMLVHRRDAHGITSPIKANAAKVEVNVN